MVISALFVSLAFAWPSPTPTPSLYNMGYHDGLKVAAAYAGAQLRHGAWLVTATVTKTPTANPEATCVAKGHDWYYKDDKTYTMWVLIPLCHPNGTPWPCVDSQIWVWTQRCGRCGLRREHEWKEGR